MTAGSDGYIRIMVEKVRIDGAGVIILTGPSSCGKGEIAKSLVGFLSLPPERHLSMGEILRQTITKAEKNPKFAVALAERYGISDHVSVFDGRQPELIEKVQRYEEDLRQVFRSKADGPSQLDWLKYCVARGLLIPDDWTERIIDARLRESADLQQAIFILDGYPRTVSAAQRLLRTLADLNIGVIRVLHLSITKEQMLIRARGRGRDDDTVKVLESRHDFYIEKVQPSIDFLKAELGSAKVSLIDAHQPVLGADGSIDLKGSIRAVTLSVMQSLGLPRYLLEIQH